MTTQMLIVKIQAVLGGRLECTPVQKRTLALEYCRLCSSAEEQLEHCMALIKAGREYPALQVAESSGILDTVNALLFVELEQWRALCSMEGLPVPMPFADEQIQLLNSLYSKGITQIHPLYRDYRRAMRLRKYRDALSIIRTISKINSYDNEARTEYNRLRKQIADKNLKALSSAMEDGNMALVCDICSQLEAETELVDANPIWREALEQKKRYEQSQTLARAKEIVAEVKKLDIEKDIEKISELVTEYNLLSSDTEVSPEDAKLIDECNQKSAAYQDEVVAQEKAAKARNLIAMELESPSKVSLSSRISTLKKLREDAGNRLDDEMKAKLNAKIYALSSRRTMGAIFKAAAAAAIIAGVAGGSYYIYTKAADESKYNSASIALSEIEELQDPNIIEERLNAFVKNYPILSKNDAFAGTIAKLRETVGINKNYIARVKNRMKDIETFDVSKASSSDFENAKSQMNKLMGEIPNLPASVRDEYSDKADAVSKRLGSAIDSRRLARSKTLRAALAEYETLLGQYENFSKPRPELDAKEAKLNQIILPLIEDVSMLFKAAQPDVEKYSDIAQRISVARSSYAKADELYAALLASRTVGDFVKEAESLERSGIMKADFSKKLSKILGAKENIKIGQLSAFADGAAAEAAVDYPTLGRGDLPENKLLTDVWRYPNEQKTFTYILGGLNSNKQEWTGGYEITQNGDEIFPSGEVRKSKYFKSFVDGKPPRGELLGDGAITAESELARNVYKTAEKRSWLKALEEIGNSNANPVFKLMLESVVFDKMSANAIASGLSFSPEAAERAARIKKIAKTFKFHSWLFEPQSKIKFIGANFYAKAAPDYENIANINKKAIEVARQNPLVMVGIVDVNGKKIFFKTATGALWGVAKENGKFMRFADPKNADIAELSPIFIEQKSTDEILKSVKESH